MASLKNRILDSAPVRELTKAVLRRFLEAESAVFFSTWPYPSTPAAGVRTLSVCLVPGIHRTVLVRVLTALLDGLPDDVEIVLPSHGIARHVRRLFADYAAIRFVDGAVDGDSVSTTAYDSLVAEASASFVLLLAPDVLAGRHVVARCLEIARASGVGDVFTGPLFDASGIVVEPVNPIGGSGTVERSGSMDVAHERIRMIAGASRSAVLMRTDLFRTVGGCGATDSRAPFADLSRRVRGARGSLTLDPRLATIDLDAGPRRRAGRSKTKHSAVPAAPRSAEQPSLPPGSGPYRILFVEDRVPRRALGQGYPRSHRLLMSLDELGHDVTLYPLQDPAESLPSIYRDMPRRIGVSRGLGKAGLRAFLNDHGRTFDVAIVARPHNMLTFGEACAGLPASIRDALPPIVYDAEAVDAHRVAAQSALEGKPMTSRAIDESIAREVALAKGASLIVTVSDTERADFARYASAPVVTLGHAVMPCPTPAPFASRQGFLFVGALQGSTTPNADGVRWFVEDVWPIVRNRSREFPRLRVAGAVAEDVREAIEAESVDVLGLVADLAPLYERARVFVAPVRFSAGIPLKVLEAAACGVPVVTTTQACRQLGWTSGVEVLAADAAEDFAAHCLRLQTDERLWSRLRVAALHAIETSSSPGAFRDTVGTIVRRVARREDVVRHAS